jgi:hypothetical protein
MDPILVCEVACYISAETCIFTLCCLVGILIDLFLLVYCILVVYSVGLLCAVCKLSLKRG